jgi:hypothetical protein
MENLNNSGQETPAKIEERQDPFVMEIEKNPTFTDPDKPFKASSQSVAIRKTLEYAKHWYNYALELEREGKIEQAIGNLEGKLKIIYSEDEDFYWDGGFSRKIYSEKIKELKKKLGEKAE